ncbi:TPA: hypothetical protein SI878_004415 [Salmonella enterica]|nr:hypothetical protein [Salmonella enterica]
MYTPSVNALLEFIRKAQGDVAELSNAINLYTDDNGPLAIIRCLADGKDQQCRFIISMFNEIYSHQDIITDAELEALAELQAVHREQFPYLDSEPMRA